METKHAVEDLNELDAPENMQLLHKLGIEAARRDVPGDDFATNFDLPSVYLYKRLSCPT